MVKLFPYQQQLLDVLDEIKPHINKRLDHTVIELSELILKHQEYEILYVSQTDENALYVLDKLHNIFKDQDHYVSRARRAFVYGSNIIHFKDINDFKTVDDVEAFNNKYYYQTIIVEEYVTGAAIEN